MPLHLCPIASELQTLLPFEHQISDRTPPSFLLHNTHRITDRMKLTEWTTMIQLILNFDKTIQSSSVLAKPQKTIQSPSVLVKPQKPFNHQVCWRNLKKPFNYQVCWWNLKKPFNHQVCWWNLKKSPRNGKKGIFWLQFYR